MKVNILNNHEVVLVDVAEDAHSFALHDLDGIQKIVFSSEIQDPLRCGGDMLRLPGIGFSILGPGTASQCSEEDAKGIVEENPGLMMPMKYGHYGKPHYHYCDTAIQSLFTYIRANGKAPETTVVIFKPAKQ